LRNILKKGSNIEADDYIFHQASEIKTDPQEKILADGTKIVVDPETPLDYAKIQAESILASARADAIEIREGAKMDGLKDAQKIIDKAREDGYRDGFAEGMAGASAETQVMRQQMAEQMSQDIKQFLESAARERDIMLTETKNDLKNLALSIAEKVISVSLASSGEIILKMIESATEKKRRCEWVKVYVAECDTRTSAFTSSQLSAALNQISDRVRLVPMPGEESGTCIIEMPDEIIDASVSTQLDNIKTILANSDD